MTAIVLAGLDGSNPLGFLAALGVLAAADATTSARLAWNNDGRWRPVLSSSLDRGSLLDALTADLRTWDGDPAVGLAYTKVTKDVARKPGSEAKTTRDLKPTPARFGGYLAELIHRVQDTRDARPLAAFLRSARRSLDYASAFGTEIATDNAGNVKPTALHFTAGQQEFLKSVLELIEHVNRGDLEEALFGPWQYTRELPVLSWDATASRDYALRANDPSKSKKTGVPGADWLAFRGLGFLPVAPVGSEIQTAGCYGGWKTGAFYWPLWSSALSVSAVRSILTIDDLEGLGAHDRRARGIDAVLCSGIRRSDPGGYGSFLPADVRPPRR